MKKNRFLAVFLPILLFSVLLSARLFFSFKFPFFSDASYQHLVIAENLLQDNVFANSVFYYSLSLFLFFFKNILFLKVFSNIFFVLANVMVYFIALRLSKSYFFSFIAALFSGFLPLFFSKTFNLLGPLSFGLFLLVFNIYAFMRSEKRVWMVVYLFSFILFSFSHWLVILYILGLAVYFLIQRLEGFDLRSFEVELSLFSIFFGLWAQVLVCKKLLLLHGANLFTLNIPSALIPVYFSGFSLSEVMTFLGVVPLITGLLVIYKYLFEKKGRAITFIISFVVLVAILFWFNLMLSDLALILLGLFLCILFARWFADFRFYVSTTKAVKFLKFFVVFFILLTSLLVFPSAYYFSMSEIDSYRSDELMASLLWLRSETPSNSVVLALSEEGSLVEFFARRSSVISDDFLTVDDSDERLSDVHRVYKTCFATEAIELLDKYGVSYILFSPEVKDLFGLERLSYADSSRCFTVAYEDDGVIIYRKDPACRLKVVG